MTNGGDRSSNLLFQVMLGIIIVLITLLGGITLFLNNQLWNKLDRVTMLIVRESDNLRKEIGRVDARVDKTCDSLADVSRKTAVLEFNGTTNGVKK